MRCVEGCRRQAAKFDLLSMLSNTARIDPLASGDNLICDGHPGSRAGNVDIGTEIPDPRRCVLS